jgi:phosphoribosylformylglycinamidine synthase I
MSRSPEICVLITDGTNCHEEMTNAFNVVGGDPEIVHVNQLRSGERSLTEYAGLGLPGGFSYGDDIGSGVVLSNELKAFLGEELQAFVDKARPIVGICNGFQVMTRTGLLPSLEIGNQSATLARNEIGHFVCKWVELGLENNVCRFTPPGEFDEDTPMHIAHGEGRFVADNELLDKMYAKGQIVFTYRQNPNGSMRNIAGVCDPSGVALGMMPHPERSVANQHEDRSRTPAARRAADVIFSNFVSYAREV